MANVETSIFCRLDNLTPVAREQKRLVAMRMRGLLEGRAVAVFDEATQIVTRLLDAPISILGVMTQNQLLIKSASGLSRVGLMNPLAQSRQLPRHESFCSYVVDSHQVLAIHDTATNPVFASSVLVGHYNIRAYLGAPLLTADGLCLGTLAVMDWKPRSFSSKDIELLAMTARWSLSEFERDRFLQNEHTISPFWSPNLPVARQYPPEGESNWMQEQQPDSSNSGVGLNSKNLIKAKLLTQLGQELRTPLTSVMGMASVLSRQVYGPLTSKQKEYLEIIYRSGQHLVSLVDEIVDLGTLDESSEPLKLTSVDIEMLCQQSINSLFEAAQARQQQIRLSVDPGNRIWLLDKDKVRQILYYLIYGVMHSLEAGAEIRIHASRKADNLNIAVWASHPWLGQSLPAMSQGDDELPLLFSARTTMAHSPETACDQDEREWESCELNFGSCLPPTNQELSSASLAVALSLNAQGNQLPQPSDSRERLGLLLSCQLAELHGGQIFLQGSLEAGYRYVVILPSLESVNERL